MTSKEYFFSTTPRQIGIEKTVEELREAKKSLLPENAQKEWELFPNKKELLLYMDKILSPKDFETSVIREIKELTALEMALAAVIYSALDVAEAIKIITYNVLTLQEYAKKVHKGTESIRHKVILGNVPGSVNIAKQWLIPSNAVYEDYKLKTNKEKQKIKEKPEENSKTNNVDYYITHTPRQIGLECTEELLIKDLKENCQPRLQKTHLVFGSINVVLKKLDVVQRPRSFAKIIKEKKLLNISSKELAVASAIHTALYVRNAIDVLFYNMIPIAEYAKTIHKETILVRQKCLRGSIEGAMKIGNTWYVPKNTKFAYAYKAKNEWRYIGKYMTRIYKKTAKQETAKTTEE